MQLHHWLQCKKIPNTVKLLTEIHSLTAVDARVLVLACRSTHNLENNCIVQTDHRQPFWMEGKILFIHLFLSYY